MPLPVIPTLPKRLRILGAEEPDALYGRPHFTPEERQQYFALSPPEKTALEQLHSLTSRLYYLLQLGYFKARQIFFVFSLHEGEEDVRYLQDHYFSPPSVPKRFPRSPASSSSVSFWRSATIASVMPLHASK